MGVDLEKKKLKVLALIWDMGNGGAQQVVINNLRFFRDDEDVDYKLISFCSSNGSQNDKVIEEEKLNVEYLGYPKSKIKIPVIRFPFNKRVERKAWEEVIKREKPDVVHVHISELLTTTLWAIEKCGISVKFDTLHSNPYRYKGYALWCIKKAFNQKGFVPICLNELQVEQARNHYGINTYEIVHNGVDFDRIRSLVVSKKEARENLGIPDDCFVIAGVGRLDPVKNYERMLEIFSEVAKKKLKVRLYIAGGGDQQKYRNISAELGIQDKVIFLGHVNHVTDVYCAADVLLVTSKSESASLTLIEAQTCGCRAVVSAGVPAESVIARGVSQMDTDSSSGQWADVIIDGGREVTPRLSEEDYTLEATNSKIKQVYLSYSKR